MADYYVDASSGNDANAGTSTGAPFATIQKAFDSATGGDVIHLSNVSTHIITSPITWTLYGSSSSQDNPLKIIPWDNGGSITIDFPSRNGNTGESIVAAEVSGNSSVASFDANPTSSNENNIYIHGVRFTSFTAQAVIARQGWLFTQCEITACAGTSMITNAYAYASYICCYFHDDSSSGVDAIGSHRQGLAYGNIIENVSGRGIVTTGQYTTIANNFIKSVGEDSIDILHDGVYTIHNTVDSSPNGFSAIDLADSSEYLLVFNNLISNCSSTADAIDFGSGTNCQIFGPNAFFNNTTDFGTIATGTVDFSSASPRTAGGVGDVNLASNPFVDSGSNDFSIDSASDAYFSGLSIFGRTSDVSGVAFGPMTIPASGGGGGGAVTTCYVSVGG
jgi:hypothetical protein